MYSKTKKISAVIILASLAATANMSMLNGFAVSPTTELPIELNNSSFQQMINDAKLSLDELSAKLPKLQEINKPLLVKYEKAKDKFDKANDELARLKAEKDFLEQKHSAFTKQCQKQATKGISSETEKEEMAKISQQIKDLVKKIAPQEIRCEVAKSQYDPINKKYQEVNEMINAVRTKIEAAQSEQTKMVEKEKEISDLLVQHNEIKNEYDQEKEKVQNLEVKVSESKEKLTKAEGEEKAKSEEFDAIIDQIERLKRELNNMDTKRYYKAVELDACKKDTSNARDKSVQIEVELQKEMAKSEEVKSNLDSVETKLAETKEQFDAQCKVVAQKCIETKSTAIEVQEKLEADKVSQ